MVAAAPVLLLVEPEAVADAALDVDAEPVAEPVTEPEAVLSLETEEVVAGMVLLVAAIT